jgi:hypothetical protein
MSEHDVAERSDIRNFHSHFVSQSDLRRARHNQMRFYAQGAQGFKRAHAVDDTGRSADADDHTLCPARIHVILSVAGAQKRTPYAAASCPGVSSSVASLAGLCEAAKVSNMPRVDENCSDPKNAIDP